MEKDRSKKILKSGVLASLLAMVLSEIIFFVQNGGFENPLALSLLKIIVFLFLFTIFYFDKESELQSLMNLMEVLVKDLKKLKKD